VGVGVGEELTKWWEAMEVLRLLSRAWRSADVAPSP
jgi:hypothetical protein